MHKPIQSPRTYEELVSLGFRKSRQRNSEYLALVRNNIAIWAKQFNEREYIIHFAIDVNGKAYHQTEYNQEIFTELETLEELIELLKNPTAEIKKNEST